MEIKSLHPNFIMPSRGSEHAGGYDLYMPEAGQVVKGRETKVKLGFAAAIPPGFVALLLPRSGTGAKHGVSLRNTCGVIDADYRGEWMAVLMLDEAGNDEGFGWAAGERVLQMVVVPVAIFNELKLVEELSDTNRGVGGFGSTGV